MNIEDKDIVKIDLPPYEESVSPFPDVETEASFEENKEEIYRRNIELAAEETVPPYRVMYPENMGAEEIYPQNRIRTDNNTLVKINISKKNLLTAALCAAIVVIVAITAFSLGRSGQAPDINASALSAADEKAKKIHNTATASIAQMYVEGVEVNGGKFENSGTVFIFGDTEKNMAELLGNSFSGYVYGVFDYEAYTVEYALWSAEPIPEEYKRKLTDSERETLSKSGVIIGCYPSDNE